MALTKDRLKQLFKMNPNAKIVRGENILFVDTGAEQVTLNVRASKLDAIVEGLNVPHIRNLPTKDKNALKKYKIRGDIDLSAIGKNPQSPVDYRAQHPKLNTSKSRGKKVLTYPEVTGTKINTVVNDFFASYLSPTSKIRGKDLQNAFEAYAKQKKVPLEQLDPNKSIFRAIRKTYHGLKSHTRTANSVVGGKKKILKANVNLLENSKDRDFAMTQKVVDTGDKYVLFTDNKLNNADAVKIGTTMQKHYGVSKPIVVVTPTGVKTIIPKQGSISVDGFSNKPSMTSKYDSLKAYNNIVSNRSKNTVASSEAYYARTQNRVEPEALQTIMTYAKKSVVDMNPREAKALLKRTTVKDVKGLAKHIGLNHKALNAYTLNDDVSLDKVLDSTKYNQVLDGAYARSDKRDARFHAAKYKKVVDMGKRLGVTKESIDIDLGNLEAGDMDSYRAKHSNMLNEMDRTFSQSIKIDPVGSRVNRADKVVPSSKAIVKALKGGSQGASWLNKHNLTSPTLANPMLNLEGNIQSQHVSSIAKAMIKDAMSGDPAKYNVDALTKLGGLMSQKDLKSFPKHFKSFGMKQLFGARDNGMRAMIDTNYLLEDVFTGIEKKFGGKNEISDIKANIKNDTTAREKTLRIAKEAFASGGGESNISFDSKEITARHQDMMQERASQLRTLANDPTTTFSGADYTKLNSHEMFLEASKTGGSGVQVGGLDLTNMKRKIDRYTDRTKKGHLSLNDYKDMNEMAGTLGYKNKTGKDTRPGNVLGFLNNQYETAFAEAYPGMKYENRNVNVGMTKSLFRDLTRQNQGSASRLGANNLNVVKFMENNKADWAPLVESFHGDKIGNTSLIFGDPREAERVKRTILTDLAKAPGIDRAKLGKLSALYDSNKIYTNRDKAAYGTLKGNVLVHPETGKNMLAPNIDANDMLNTLLRPYNLDKFVSKPGDAFWGKKLFESPMENYESFFDPTTYKMHRDARLTKAQNNQALKYIETIGKTKEFQTLGGIDAPNMGDVQLSMSKAMANGNQFVDRQAGALMAGDKHSDRVRANLKGKVAGKLASYGNLIDEAIQNKEWQTARSYIKGIEDIGTTFSGKVNKTNIEFAQKLIADPDAAVNGKMTSSARGYLNKEAVKIARSYGAELLEGGEPISDLQLQEDKIAAKKAQARILKYDKIGYKASDSTIGDYASKYNTNQDPQIEATRKAIEILDGMTNESQIRKNMGASPVKVTNFSRELPKVELSKTINKNKPQQTQLGLFAGNVIRPYDGTGEVPLKIWSDIPKDNKIWNSMWQDDNGYFPKRVRNWDKENMREKARLFKHRFKFSKRFSRGGKIPGKGMKDEVPALLTKGEVVVDRSTSEKLGIHNQDDYGRFKAAVAKGQIGKFATGGVAGIEDELKQLLDLPDLDTPAKKKVSNLLNNLQDLDPAKAFKASRGVAERGIKLPQAAINIKEINVGEKQGRPPAPSGGGRYTPDASTSPLSEAGMYEAQRTAKNVTIDLAANKAYVDMGKTDLEIGQAFEFAKTTNMDSATLNKAKSNFAGQKLGDALGLSSKDIKNLKEVGSAKSTRTATDLKPKLVEKLAGMDFDKLNNTMESLKELKLNDIGLVDKGINQAVGLSRKNKTSGIDALGGKKSLDKFSLAMNEIKQDAQILGEMFDMDPSVFKDLKGSKKKIAKKLKGAFAGYDFEKTNVQTNNKTLTELRHMGNALTSIDNVFKDDAFKTGAGVRNERSGFQATREDIGRRRQLRESARSRVGEFGALTMQNAAFGMSYALIGGVQQGLASTIGFVANFDDSMKNLQAITGDTTEGLNVMQQAVEQVSTETKFSALEIADAATILGQAGFSAVDISKSLDGVVQLATATGSKLEDATQVLTSTLTIWDKSLSDSKKQANEFTAAINESKLDIESLTGAIQYAGNIAAAGGISSTDVLTMTSLLKDAGIKRSSTLGTGQRLLYGDFTAPSKKFIKSLKSAGIELEDFTRTFDQEGIEGTLRLMKDAGYGLAQASRGMEVREKAIYIAAINQLDKFKGFRESITGTNASYIANKVQMEGMGNTFDNMLNSWQINLNKSLESSKSPITGIMNALTIEVDKRNPANNLGVKGYSLEDKYTPVNEGSGALATVASMVGIGYAGKFAQPYLKEAMAAGVKAGAEGTLLQRGLAGAAGAGAKLGINNYTPGFIKGGAIGAAGGILGALGAPEGSTGAGATSGLIDALSFVAGGSIIDKMALKHGKDGQPAKFGKGFNGGLNKLAIAGAIMTLDKSLLAPSREEGGLAGILGTGVLGAGLGASIGGIPGAVAGGVGGLAFGVMSETTSPVIGLSKALSSLTNDLKATTSEVTTISKTADSLRDLSNFALRTGPNATDTEKISKFRLNVKEGEAVNDKVQGLEAILKSFSPGFEGFNFGQTLATTALSSVTDGVFNIQQFTADGVNISSEVVEFKGTAADALATTLSSASRAAYQAQSAPGGSYDKMFAEIATKDLKGLGNLISDSDTAEDRSAILEQQILKPIRELFKAAPEVATGNLDALKETITEAYKVKEENLPGQGIFTKSIEYFEESAKTRNELKTALAAVDSLAVIAGQNGATPAQLETLAVTQIKALEKTLNKGRGFFEGDVPLQDVVNQYAGSKQYEITRRNWVNKVQEASGLNKLQDTLIQGKNKLRDIDIAGVNLARKSSLVAADTLSKSLLKVGPTVLEASKIFSKTLGEITEPLTTSLLTEISKYGDLRKIDSETVVDDGNQTILNYESMNRNIKASVDEKIDKQSSRLSGRDAVSVGRAKSTTLDKAGAEILGLFKQVEDWADNTVSELISYNSLEELDAATGDLTQHKMYKQLEKQLGKAGIGSVASFRDLQAQGPQTRESLLARGVDDLRKVFSDDVNLRLDNRKKSAVASLDLQQIHAKEMLVQNLDFNIGETLIGGQQSKDKLSRQYEFQKESAFINFSRQVRDINLKTGYQREDALTNHTRTLEKIGINFTRTYDALELGKERALEDIAIGEVISLKEIDTQRTRAYEDLNTKAVRAFRDLDTNLNRSHEDLNTRYERGLRDIATNTTRAYEDLGTKLSRGLQDISVSTARAYQDLQIRGQRAFEDLAIKSERGYEDIAIQAERGFSDIFRQETQALEDIATNLSRGLQDIAIANERGLEDISTNEVRAIDRAILTESRSIEDLYTSISRAQEDLDIKQEDILSDIMLKMTRSIEDVLTNFDDTMAALTVNFENNIAAIERSRQDTIDAFERSLTKPTPVTLDSAALITIADQFGDTALALDAHKAALTANTTAVKQQSALLKTQEDIVQAAYIDAYKKTGGEVYNEDGTINQSFETAYNDYLASNSEQLVDTVLASALSSAFAGSDFDILSALQSPTYIADAVSTPTPGTTIDSAVIGSGYTVDELVAALYDVKSGEVRVTTEAGVILEAQGGMEGALFDLESAMIGIDIKLREAGISFQQSVEAAQVSLDNALRDIELAYQRDLEDSWTAYDRSLESITLALSRGLADIELNTARAMEDIATSVQYSIEDLATSTQRATEDLILATARAGEDLAVKIERAIESLEISLSRAADDLALSLLRGAQDINLMLTRGAQDIALSAARATEDLFLAIQRGAEDIALANQRAIEDLDRAIVDAAEDIAANYDRAQADLITSLSDAAQDIELSTSRAMEDLSTKIKDAVAAVELAFDRNVVNATITMKQNIEDAALTLRNTIETIGTEQERALVAASTSFTDSLADLRRNYEEQLVEIDISITQALDKLARGYENAIDVMALQHAQGLETIEAQHVEAVANLYNKVITWSNDMSEAMAAGLSTMTWDTTILLNNLQTQINQGWDKLQVDASPIISQVEASFKVAVNSDAMKLAINTLGVGTVEAMKAGFTKVQADSAETITQIAEQLEKTFDATFINTLNKATTDIGVSMPKLDGAVQSIGTTIPTSMEGATVALENSTSDLNNTVVDMKDVGTNLSSATTSISTGANSMSLAVSTLQPLGQSMVSIGGDTANGAMTLMGAVPALGQAFSGSINTTAIGMSSLAGVLPSLGSSVAASADYAISLINAALARLAYAASVSIPSATGYSTGGIIPGYGGGDIVPAMLEPGEVILRKEVVREFGADKFNALNQGVGGLDTGSNNNTGLPSPTGQAISIQMNVQAGGGVELLEKNMERIADGVRKVFQEYS